jgi:RNA polymerase sigma-70 factor (ECF subfamily)
VAAPARGHCRCAGNGPGREVRSEGTLDEWGRDEQELVRRCKEGSEAAYAVLVRLHRPRLYTLAYRLLLDREAAEDVVQETFIAAFRQMERFEPRPSLAAWLNTIALRTAGRAAARQRARPRTSIDAPAFRADGGQPAGSTAWPGDALALADTDPAADPEAAAQAAALRGELAAAIAALPFKYRAAVVVRHVMGLDYAEAARALDLPLNTFKSNLLRGTRLLREHLAGRLDRAAETTGAAAPPSGRLVGATMADHHDAPAAGEASPTPARTAVGRTAEERPIGTERSPGTDHLVAASTERHAPERPATSLPGPERPATERIARG